MASLMVALHGVHFAIPPCLSLALNSHTTEDTLQQKGLKNTVWDSLNPEYDVALLMSLTAHLTLVGFVLICSYVDWLI
jgi:hypothetical protein